MLRKVYQSGVLPANVEQDVRNVIRILQDSEQLSAMSRYFVNEVWQLTVWRSEVRRDIARCGVAAETSARTRN